jgi:hypothetical protein
MLAAFDHRCYRSSHGDGHSSADTWMSLLQLFCYVATEGGCACYQRHSACLLRRHPWRTPRSSKRTRLGPSPTPHHPPMPPKLERRSCSHGVLEHGAATDGKGGVATRGWWSCYFVVSASATKGGSRCYKERWRDGVCYKRRRRLLQRAALAATKRGGTAAATKVGGATVAATIGVNICYRGRRRLLL